VQGITAVLKQDPGNPLALTCRPARPAACGRVRRRAQAAARRFAATVAMEHGRTSLAHHMLQLALASDPAAVPALVQLGALHERAAGDLEEAEEAYQAALDLAPGARPRARAHARTRATLARRALRGR